MLELARVLHDAQEDLLGHVFGGGGLAELAEHEIVEGPVMTPHECGERLPIAPLVADHQRFVGCVTRGGGHGARAGRRREIASLESRHAGGLRVPIGRLSRAFDLCRGAEF